MKKIPPHKLRRLENAPSSRRRGPGRPPKSPQAGYPQVVARISRDAGFTPGQQLQEMISEYSTIPADFPRALYSVIDHVSALDPYISDYILTTVSLGNPGHKLYITASSEAKADAAIKECNELAERCWPFGGGMEGLINSGLHQLARTCATCTEWVPDKYFDGIQRAYKIPIKTLHFRYANAQGDLELCQMQSDGSLHALLPVQTSYHGLVLRDTNPYPIPFIISALKPAHVHSKVMENIEAWIDKVSALGVLLATLKTPPRKSGEDQTAFDARCKPILQEFANMLAQNLKDGLGVGFDNVLWQFQNTASGAEGAKELLQVNLQALFAALQTDPVFFGWNWGTSDTFARIVFQKMLQSLDIFRLGVKRDMEHGLRLHLALRGMADVQVSIKFNDDIDIDRFKEAEARQMDTQAIVLQLINEIIVKEEARKALGWEEKRIEAGAYVAAFNADFNRYVRLPHQQTFWQVGTELELTDEQRANVIAAAFAGKRRRNAQKPKRRSN